jgi:molecular chaperone GrpE
MGVEPIKSVGEHFDPLFHEAVSTEERSDVPHNTISEEMLRGYRIGNRVIRHSLVKVTLGDPAGSTPATDRNPDMAIEAAE